MWEELLDIAVGDRISSVAPAYGINMFLVCLVLILFIHSWEWKEWMIQNNANSNS